MPEFASLALEQFGREVFEAAGAPPSIAASVTRSLVLSDLSGHPSHGIMRVPSYVEFIDRGWIDPEATPSVSHKTSNTVLVSGNWGFGQLAAAEATESVTAMAKDVGIALAGVIDCNHVGRLGEWVEKAAAADVIVIMTIGGPYALAAAPFGGGKGALGTNPIAAGVPAGSRDPLILDFATTVLPVGKLRVARARGLPVPENSVLDRHGRPTTDPEDFFDGGVLLHFGGHKGYALAVLIDALASCLTGSEKTERDWKLGATLIGIDPAVLRPREEYGAAVDQLFDRITDVPPAPGFSEVLIPGEPERRARKKYDAAGVEVDDATLQALLKVADELGVEPRVLRGDA